MRFALIAAGIACLVVGSAAFAQADPERAGAQEPALEHDGGVCAGISWIRLLPGERVRKEEGPDFFVLRFEGPSGPDDHPWGVYAGGFAQVRGDGPFLLQRDGVVIHRAIENGEFRGYLAQRGHWQNHFFGSVFSGAATDRAFFDRVDFGARGQSLCARGR